MAKKPGPKILRVGLIQNQRILEERLFRKPQTVRVGRHYKKNTLVVPASNLPKTFPVFAWSSKGYVLQFTEKMTGRISRGQGVETLEELRTKGVAKKKGKVYQLRLNPKMRGRVAIGEATVLFQFVTPPPERSRPVLPASMRGGILGSGIDRPLAMAVFFAAVLQVGFVLYLELAVEIDEDTRYRWVQDDVHAEVDVEEEEDEDDDPDPEEEDDDGEEDPDPDEDPDPVEPDPDPEDDVDPDELADEDFQDTLDATDAADDDILDQSVVGVVADEGGMAEVVDGAMGEVDIDNLMADTTGLQDGDVTEERIGRPDGGNGGRVESDDDLEIEEGNGAGTVGDGGGEELATVEGDVTTSQPRGEVGNAGDFMSRIMARDQQVQACYQAELTTNREARGEVVIELTVDEGRGGRWRVTNARVITDTVGGGVGSCVAGALNGAGMPEPDSGESVVLEMPYTFAPR